MNLLKDELAQATIEYILLFAFMSMISIGIVKSIGGSLSTSVGTLAFALSQELSTGVCARECFYNGYANSIGR
jgi:Flp pilus assembly pilin Flp